MAPRGIAEAAAQTGITAHTLRYYERIGLLDPVGRDGAGRRRYSDEDIAWVGFLQKLRRTGMPIQRMGEYIALVREGTASEPARLALLEAHRDQVVADMGELADCLDAIDTKIALYRRSTP
jgi:DNA-binding transcriptional MerR regulator